MYLNLCNQKFNEFGDMRKAFNQAMSQLFQLTMRESNPKLVPELFDHKLVCVTYTVD